MPCSLSFTRVAVFLSAAFFTAPTAARGATTVDTFGTGSNAFGISFIDIRNTNNPVDVWDDRGKVNYNYRISTYEVSAGMISKATAGGLTNVSAWWSNNQPAGSVTWYEAAAFVNWLNTNSGYTAAYNLFRTNYPGVGEDWAMNLWSISNSAVTGSDSINRFRNKDAFYFLPGQDEWYKAAYYNPAGSNYWTYPSSPTNEPTAVSGGTNAGTAVFSQSSTIQNPADITNAGGPSPYGTMAQGGNITEWTESGSDGFNDMATELRVVRGGAFDSGEGAMRAIGGYAWHYPFTNFMNLGFRVASAEMQYEYWAPAAGGGGSGIWSPNGTNWASSAGTQGSSNQASGTALIFAGTAGTVSVADGGVTVGAGMQFSTNGYLVQSNTITLSGANASANTITTDAGVTATISSTLAGSNGLSKAGAGTLTLSGVNTFTGAGAVAAGRLVVNGTNSTNSSFAVNSGASLSGTGRVGALTVGGTIAPGNSIGTLSAGSTVFNTNGSFELEIANWTGTAGTGWDLLAITGSLTLSNTAVNPFTINLVSMANSTTPGLSTFDPNQNYTINFATFTGSLSGSSFNTNLFTINTNSFQNTVNGAFRITNTPGALSLVYNTFAIDPTSPYVWTNGSGNWSLASAWTNNLAPTDGARLIFRGAAGTSTNNAQVSSLHSVTFSNTTGSIVLAGSAFAIGTNGIANLSGHAHTVSNNVSLFGATTFSATSNSLTFAGDVTNGGSLLTVAGSNNTAISGVISGAGGLAKTGAGTLTISGANTYSGGTLVGAGALSGNSSSIQGDVTNDAAVIFNQTTNGDYAGLMSGSGSLTKNSGGTLTLSGANTFSGAIALNGGALSISAGNNLGSSTNAVAFSNAASLVTTASLSTARGFTGNGTLDIADGTTLTNSGTIDMSQLALANTGTFEMSGASKTLTVFTNPYSLVFNAAATLTNTGAAALVGSVAASNSTGTAVMAGAYSVNNNRIFMVNNGSADTDLLVSGPISSPFAVLITKSGAGRLELLGTNSGFLGSFRLGQTNAAAAGEILIGNKDALGRHVFRLYSGTLMAGTDLTGANAITNQIELGGLVGTPAIIGGTNAIQLSGPVSWLSTASDTSALRVDNTTIISGTIATNTSTNAIDLSGNGTLVLSAFNNFANALNIGSGLTVVAAQTTALGATNGRTTVASGGSLVISNLGYSPAEAVTISGTGVGGSGALRGAGTATFGGAITLGADATIAADSGASFSLFGGINAGGNTLVLAGEGNTRFTGVISNGALVKLGSGTATMTGANTYTGGTLVSAGALQISNGGSVASTITNNASLIYNLDSFGATNTNAITGTGSLTKLGSGTIILSGSNTYTGGTLVSAGALQIGQGGTNGSLAGTITNNASLVFDRSDNYTQSNAITGSGTLTKQSAGTLTLTADVTQSSTTIANGFGIGTLQIGNGGTNGSLSGTITGQAGTSLIFNRSDDYVRSNSMIISGLVTKLGAGTLTLTATNNAGTVLVSAGALQIGDGGTNGSLTTPSSSITNNASLIFNRSDNYTHSTQIVGSGTMTKLGAGTTILTTSNTQSGTLISEGALQINFVLSGPITNNALLILSNTPSSVTQSGVISGTGSLTKLGANTNVLTAANTYSGGTLVSDGTLRVGDGVTNGSLIGAITNNASVIFDRSDNQTYVSAITGTGSITKVNTGTLTLTADNTQTGIRISAGALQIGDGGTNGSLVAPRITNNSVIIFNRSDNVLLTNSTIGSISGSGSLRKLGAGTLTLGNTNLSPYSYSGGTLVSEGTLEIGGGLIIGSTGGTVTNNSKIVLNVNGSIGSVVTGTGTLEKVGAGTSTLVQGGVQSGATTVSGGRLLVNGTMSNSAITVNSGASLGGANMGLNSSDSLGALTVSGTLAPGSPIFTGYGIGLMRARNTVFDTNGSFELNVADWSVANNVSTNGWDSLVVQGSLTLSNTSANPFTVNLVSLTASNTLGLSTFDKNRNYTNIFVSVTGSMLGNAFSQDMFVLNTNGFQNPVNGSFSIITNKQSSTTYLSLVYSTLFNAADAYIWTNGSGNWSLGSGWSNPSTTGLAPSNGATVVFSGGAGNATNNQVTSLASITFSNTTGSVRLAGNAFTIGTNGIANVSDNAHTISNAVTLGGAAAFNAASNNLTFAGTVANGGFLLSATGNSNTVVSGSISGSGGLAKTGAGTLTLSGANNYSGGTLVSAGTLQVGSGSTSGSLSSVITNNAALIFNRSDNVTHSSAINGAGSLTKLGGGTLTLTASNTQGGTLISAGAVQIGNGGSTGFLSGPITNNSAFVFNRFDNVTQTAAITGTGILTKLGGGTLALTASNSQNGTLVSAGTLQIGNGGTTGSLGGPITNNAALVLNRSDNLTQSGAISGTGSLTKLGAGTATLTGASSYSGATTITAGALVVDGALSNSTVTVGNGTTLAGRGSVGGIVLNLGSTISPGNSPGTLNVLSNAVWNPGANYNWQIYNASGTKGATNGYDWLNISGSLDLSALSVGSEFNINLWSLSGISPDTNGNAIFFDNTRNYTWTILTASNGITGFSADKFFLNTGAINGTGGFANALGAGTLSLVVSGNDLNLVFYVGEPIPEPGTWAAAALLLGAAGYMRWRKRARVS